MNIPSPRPDRRARIEIVPLIDIIFFLLATFVLVSLSMIQNQGIDIRLPVSSTARDLESPAGIVISVRKGGAVSWNGEGLPRAELEQRLQAVKRSDAAARVTVQGDAAVPLGEIVEIFDLARRNGIEKVGLQTRPTPQSP